MIQIEYDKKVNVLRLADGDNDTEAWESHLSGVDCSIQPLDDTFNEDTFGSFGRDRLLFCDILDIKEQDKIVYSGITYRVVAVDRFDDFRRQEQHLEVTIREFQE